MRKHDSILTKKLLGYWLANISIELKDCIIRSLIQKNLSKL